MNRFSNLFFAACIGWTAIPGMAQESVSFRPCEVSTLKGTYLLTISGTRPAPRVLPGLVGTPGDIETVTGIFLQIFDGKNGLFQAPPVTVKGALSGLFPDQPGRGSYELETDCTGTFTVHLPQLPAPLVNRMVVYDRGKSFRAVVSSPQALMIQVEGQRID